MHIPGHWTRIRSCTNKNGSIFEIQILWPARPLLKWGINQRQALRNGPHPQTSCRCKKTWNSRCNFLRSWWRGGRDGRLILFWIWFEWVWIVVIILSILSSLSSFCVGWTGIGRGAVEIPLGHCRVALQYGPAPNTAYKLYTFSNIMVGRLNAY